MAKKRRHTIDYDPSLDDVLPDVVEVPAEYGSRTYDWSHHRPSRRSHNIRINKADHRIEVDLDDNEPLTDRELDNEINRIIDKQASRQTNGRLRTRISTRERKKCERAKAARRAAAFASGGAGRNRKPKPPARKYRC